MQVIRNLSNSLPTGRVYVRVSGVSRPCPTMRIEAVAQKNKAMSTRYIFNFNLCSR